MSSERGNVSRSRAQRHQNAQAFRNDKYDSSAQRKKMNAKLHDGLCQHCKEVLEWRVKFNKYKQLTQSKRCVKCLQKTVKDSYHVICKPCASELELCAKCGKRRDTVIPIETDLEKMKDEPSPKDQRHEFEKGSNDLEDNSEDLDLLAEEIKN